MKRCPECKGKNYIHGWAADRWVEFKNGKAVKRGYSKAGHYHSFQCLDCGWERTDVE